MKKLYFTILFFLSTVFLFADFSQEQKAFVSSSIQDKVSILKKQIAILEKDLPLLDMALDFCLTNAAILSDSTHLHDLLFVSLYALPQDNLEAYDSALKKLFFLYNKACDHPDQRIDHYETKCNHEGMIQGEFERLLSV